MKTQELKARFENLKDVVYSKSQWSKGVNEYAMELLEQLTNNYDVIDRTKLKDWLLNGATNWKDYSWSGCSLICDYDIAERLATNSEIKKCTRKDGSLRKPNGGEEWLDTQARALHQAYTRITVTFITYEHYYETIF